MNTYSTWDFYRNTYRGELSEQEYCQRAFPAKSKIIELTFGRSESYRDCRNTADMTYNLSWCECVLIDRMASEAAGRAELPIGLASINNDGYSVSKAVNGSTEESTAQAEYREACETYLRFPVNLMYRGGVRCGNVRKRRNCL